MNDLMNLLKERRTYRRFCQKPISEEILAEILTAARYASSAANKQPLSYVVVKTPQKVQEVFAETKWAGISSEGTGTAEGWRRAGAVYRRGAEFENQPELRYGRRAGDFEYDAGSVESWGRKLYHRRVQPAKAFGAVWIDGGSEAAYGGGIWLSIPYQQD